MNSVCYVCNQSAEQFQQNFTEIQSKYSDHNVGELIERIINGQFSHRDLNDKTHGICGDCLNEIFVYDSMCLEVTAHEEKIRALILATETAQSKDNVKVKIEPPLEVCHSESVFVNEFNELEEECDVKIKTEPEEDISVINEEDTLQIDGITSAPTATDISDSDLMETTTAVMPVLSPVDTDSIAMPKPIASIPLKKIATTVPVSFPSSRLLSTLESPSSNSNFKYKRILLKKNGKLVKMALVKCAENQLKGTNVVLKPSERFQIKDGKLVTFKPNSLTGKKPLILKSVQKQVRRVETIRPPNQIDKHQYSVSSVFTSTTPTSTVTSSISTHAILPATHSASMASTSSTPKIITQVPILTSIPDIIRFANPPVKTNKTLEQLLQEHSLDSFLSPNEVEQPYRRECNICQDGVIYTKTGFTRHLSVNHNKKVCDICDIKITQAKLLRHHMNWHDKHPGFTCRRCYYELDDKESYKAHLKLHENKGKLDCVLCDKVFNDSRGLRRHAAQAHGSQEEHLCEQCGKKFKTASTLKIHRNTHINEKTVRCTLCPKMFKNRQFMLKHRYTHKTDRPFTCSVCGMKFKRKCHMEAHERRHTEDTKTEKCSFCPAAFEHQFYLREHIKRKHGAEKPKGTLENAEPPSDKEK